ncbi:MAG: hypothetical protein J6A69_08265 [Clostridia bacterium]|nr:hypothetical protein [Clostridia bacterium]
MTNIEFREELTDFYRNKVDDMCEEFCVHCLEILDSREKENMSVYEQKALQYEVISEEFEPVIFKNSPFYYETGTISAHCDGARDFRNNKRHAGGWTFWKNWRKFLEQDEELWELKKAQTEELMYLVCGPYNDVSQHFTFYYPTIIEMGLKGIYEKAQKALNDAKTEEEKQFLDAMCTGLLCLKKMSEKFALKAKKLAEAETDEKLKANYERIYKSAIRTPWEKPETFYEVLNTYAFFRTPLGALEGVGLNTFGRVDMDLYLFYKKEIENGNLTQDEAYELVVKFLLTWDLHYDHDMKMVEYADHELENTYVLGGCDKDGNEVYNEVTKMFLQATREEEIIYPKIKCRFSKNSPKEYLDEINKAVINGTTTVIHQNDDATIPALVRGGRTLEEARNYIVSGCWDLKSYGVEKADAGTYVNLLKPFEFALHKLYDKMDKVNMHFEIFDDAKTFEEIYQKVCRNCMVLFKERLRVTTLGGNIHDKVDVLPLFSSTLKNCIENKKDFTAGGAKYRDDIFMCFGLPNVVDSLLAIKELCFDKKKYTLDEMLNAVRNNWEGYEQIRTDAVKCHGWGDGSDESNNLANRFNNDLYDMLSSLKGTYGGKVHLSHLTYTEIRFWGEKTLATPDGRKNGEYFSQGLTPSRLKKIPSVTDVVNSFTAFDGSKMSGNSVVNIILPAGKTTLDICEAFLRAVSSSAIQSLQLNCTSKEELLDAQKHPEKYPSLIVRVCGFSAKFTSLSPEWQQEVISRNFYE